MPKIVSDARRHGERRSLYAPLHSLEYFYGRMAGLHLLTLTSADVDARYKATIALGSSVPPTVLFRALGVRFPITEADIASAAVELAVRLGIGDKL